MAQYGVRLLVKWGQGWFTLLVTSAAIKLHIKSFFPKTKLLAQLMY
jgi:hypothetical protein